MDSTTLRTYVLSTNDIIIGKTDGVVHNSHLILQFPVRLIHQRTNHGPLGFMLEPWVPTELLKETRVMINTSYIIAELKLSDAMVRFYENWVLAEADKIKKFSSLFEKQIGAIEKQYTERTKYVKEQQQKSPISSSSDITDAMIDMFENLGDEWGDPSVTH